MRCIVDLSG